MNGEWLAVFKGRLTGGEFACLTFYICLLSNRRCSVVQAVGSLLVRQISRQVRFVQLRASSCALSPLFRR